MLPLASSQLFMSLWNQNVCRHIYKNSTASLNSILMKSRQKKTGGHDEPNTWLQLGDKECLQDFGKNNNYKTIFGGVRRWEDNIKIDIMEAGLRIWVEWNLFMIMSNIFLQTILIVAYSQPQTTSRFPKQPSISLFLRVTHMIYPFRTSVTHHTPTRHWVQISKLRRTVYIV